jgi:NAD(P)H-flavin reductase/ferredoxin
VHVNDQGFIAHRGELLLDAALINGVDMPHDCRSGVCGTCKIRVLSGMVIGGECEERGMVKACQARVITDLELLVEPVPEVLTTKGVLLGVTPLAPDVVELSIRPSKAISYLPGQYYKFQFRGYPARYFSPTAPMDRPFDGHALHLHVRRIPDGRVSPALGREIQPGHPVTLTGPHGSAYFRPEQHNRLVLIGTGTGFAPIWSIAEAAVAENPNREIVLIVGAKTLASLYMAPAFRRLKDYRNVQLIPTVSDKPPNVARIVRKGRPTDFMPALSPDDVIYACGAPAMVDSIKEFANASGAMFYADPFTPSHGADDGERIFAKAMAWLASLAGFDAGQPQYKALPKPQPQQSEAPQLYPPQDYPQQDYAPDDYAPPPREHRLPPRGAAPQLPSGIRPTRSAPTGMMQRRGPRANGYYEGVPAD